MGILVLCMSKPFILHYSYTILALLPKYHKDKEFIAGNKCRPFAPNFDPKGGKLSQFAPELSSKTPVSGSVMYVLEEHYPSGLQGEGNGARGHKCPLLTKIRLFPLDRICSVGHC